MWKSIQPEDSPWAKPISNRQAALEKHRRIYPEDQFYLCRRDISDGLDRYFITKPGADGKHEAFFKAKRDAHETCTEEMGRLERLLVLPFAAGKAVMMVDLRFVPWLVHAQMSVWVEDIKDIDTLEKQSQNTVMGLKIGPRTRKWWRTSRTGEREEGLPRNASLESMSH